MAMKSIVPVILSGGAGSRLWPMSTHAMPKQFHALHGPDTMFAATFSRVKPGQEVRFSDAIIVCGHHHEQPVRDEIEKAKITGARMILEPMAKNTAPALAVAALLQAETDPDALMLILPADHVITKPDQLHKACLEAKEAALSGKIVTFAIKPLGPETGYGYIKSGERLSENVFGVDSFREKPDLATAQAYVNEGCYSWNAGIFYFKASALIDELALYAPQVLEFARKALLLGERRADVVALDSGAFSQSPSISVDYAVMEKTKNAAVVPVDMGWSDVGSFATLWELAQKDESGNFVQGSVAVFDTNNCYVTSKHVPIALIGVSDLLVISTPQGILITHRDSAQDVRLAAQAFQV
jgi:mannose-1-phosphate guanylyltransferase / mannose-6-phosphate isomerase